MSLLKPGGYLFITVPNAVNVRKRLYVLAGKSNMMDFDIYYWYPGAWRGHVREYTKGDLCKLAGHLGLDILELSGVDHFLSRLPRLLRPPYVAVTSLFDGFKDSLCLVARKPAAWVPRREVPDHQRTQHYGAIPIGG